LEDQKELNNSFKSIKGINKNEATLSLILIGALNNFS
tara:strand:- start:68 stop:178 length:111 start_codon:yes stop_codon:yes gene_type:complete